MGIRLAITMLLAAFLLLDGCGRQAEQVAASSVKAAVSPLAGTWTGKSDMKDRGLGTFVNSIEGGPLTGPSALTLNPDGTGFLKAGKQPERPISWQQQGDKVILQTRDIQDGDSGSAPRGGPWVGTLSPDHQTMRIDLDKVTVTVTRQAGT